MSDDYSRWIVEEQVHEVALHEAGHAVVSVLTGAGVSFIYLRQADEESGLYIGQVTPANPLATDEHQDAMIAAAGLVAESIRRGESLEACVDWVREKVDPEGEDDISGHCDERTLLHAEEHGVDLGAAVRDARELLSSHWPAVGAVVAALLAKWTPGSFYTALAGDEVQAIVETEP